MAILFPDAIHGEVAIEHRHRELLESVALARLRNIRQLGFTLASYPGAVHTRFEHTLGTVRVLQRLLQQCGVSRDPRIVETYTQAALLSEIGIYPLSWSTRAIFARLGFSKDNIARRIFDAFIRRDLVSEADEAFLLDGGSRQADWLVEFVGGSPFDYMDPVKLASTIDYVLRDAHYTGRYDGSFDYRYFSTLELNSSVSTVGSVRASLAALHRSIDNLNITYGDPLRRGLTSVLVRLSERLEDGGYLDWSALEDDQILVMLDDDEFLQIMGDAVGRAWADGDLLAKAFYEVVTQRFPPRVETVSLEDVDFSAHDDAVKGPLLEESSRDKVMEAASEKFEVETESVVIMDELFDREIGYRMFGTEFGSYSAATLSREFRELTGLAVEPGSSGDELTELKVLVVDPVKLRVGKGDGHI